MNHELIARIDGLFLGKVEHRWEGRGPSAIHKTAVSDVHEIDENGFVDDAQADLVNHGGRDKAIHHYAADHYPDWITQGDLPQGSKPAAFGENISTTGMTEETLCVGDILRLGTAVVQISQGRQPCWKVAEYTQNRRMAYLFQKTGRTGWYYRVLEHGQARAGDEVCLLERPQPQWSVKRVTAALLARAVSHEDFDALARIPELAEEWRDVFAETQAARQS